MSELKSKNNKQILVIQGDITQQKVDAIVNAANQSLLPGGGVSGAIHKAAGLGLQEECIKLGWCEEGEAKITKGYNLAAKWVIHTVGPVWEGGNYGEEKLLASCYRRSLEIAGENKINLIAFPAISTGIYRYAIEQATQIAITEVKKNLEEKNEIERVIFVCFSPEIYNCYQTAVKENFM